MRNLHFIPGMTAVSAVSLAAGNNTDLYGRALPGSFRPVLHSDTPKTMRHVSASMLTDGDSLFRDGFRHHPGSWPEAVTVGDVTGDGRNDVVMTTTYYFDSENDHCVFVYPQQADGTLGEPDRYPYRAMANRTGLQLTDLDADGVPDIVVGHDQGLTVLLADGSGGFDTNLIPAGIAANTLSAFDVNLDGDADLVGLSWSAGAEVLLGDGAGGFFDQYPLATNAAGYNDQEAGDLNNDGFTDLAVMSGQSYAVPNLSVHLNDGDGNLRPPDTYFVGQSELTSGIGLGDIDNDGLTDVVLSRGSNSPTHLWLYYQNEAGTLSGPETISSYDIPETVEVADINRDGLDDVLVLHGGWLQMGVYLQGPEGLTDEQLVPIPYASHYSPYSLAIGDIDSDGCPDAAIADYNHGLVTLTGQSCPEGPKLARGVVEGVGTDWMMVDLPHAYGSMVVVATPGYDVESPPAVVRIRDAEGSSFQMKVDPAGGVTPTNVDVHYLVVEEGVYTEAEHGVTLEAVKFSSTVTDHRGSWAGEAREYANAYVNPVVVGQVMSYNDPAFSTFWARGSSRAHPPSANRLFVGKTVSEDPDRVRLDETVGYIVIEAGSGEINGVGYVAGLGSDSVRGIQNNPPFFYPITGVNDPTAAVASLAGMDGPNGGWAVLYGDAPVSATGIGLAVDEDQARDGERKHTTEQVGYIVVE